MAQDAEGRKTLNRIERELQHITGLDSIVFINKDKALSEFKQDFGEEMIEALPFNPLPPSFIIYPGDYYKSASQSKLLRNRLKLIEGVEEISKVPAYMILIDKWKTPIIIISIFFILFIGGSMSLIVSNAVKLNLYTRKERVVNMKYCGAGEAFITIPFLLEGLILGAMGSLFGIATTVAAFFFLQLIIPGTDFKGQWQIILLLLLFTAILGSWASFRAVRKFIHETQ
jgi:cell division transport system permease protein